MSGQSIIVAVFPKEEDAMHAEHQLHVLDDNREVALGSLVILRKKQDGMFEYLKRERNGIGKDTLIGFAIGGLATILTGPLLFFVGMLAGTGIGAAVGYGDTKIDKDTIEKIKAEIGEGDIALVANCVEHASTALDETMQNYDGAKLYRTTA